MVGAGHLIGARLHSAGNRNWIDFKRQNVSGVPLLLNRV